MLSIEIQLFGLRRTNNKKLFVSLPKADDRSQEAAPNQIKYRPDFSFVKTEINLLT